MGASTSGRRSGTSRNWIWVGSFSGRHPAVTKVILLVGITVHLHPALVLPEHLFTVDVNAEYNSIGDEGCWWLTQPKGRGEQPFSSSQGQGNAMLNEGPCPSMLRVLNLSINNNRVDGNFIGYRGCKWLSRGDWPLLLEIYLGSWWNHFGAKGVRYLSKGQWPQLRVISIGSICCIN